MSITMTEIFKDVLLPSVCINMILGPILTTFLFKAIDPMLAWTCSPGFLQFKSSTQWRAASAFVLPLVLARQYRLTQKATYNTPPDQHTLDPTCLVFPSSLPFLVISYWIICHSWPFWPTYTRLIPLSTI
ncbi:hypothetical protein BDP27DRAFT_612945 [Rhodocollybia butyracea]|uniref:Uncharacterized protein n=1 Tax=Rhodocollybia butyracea TaxID=206335 RepID=A0A9P5PQU3_9AGAR|nr:hypothetical protein BDP27DRAFT_612945 [Rhodocollybia butyracea]